MFHKQIKIVIIFFLVLFVGFASGGFVGPVSQATNDALSKTDDAAVNNVYFPRVGETLEYDLWVKSIIHGGKQTVKVLSRESGQDRDQVHVRCAMKTIGIAWNLTKYSEVEDVILDGKGLYPLSIRREIHQGKTISVEKVEFDYTRGIATRSYSVDGGKVETSEIKLPGIVQDAVSLQFFLRKGDFQKGINKLYYYENGMVEETSYQVSEGTETLKLGVGTYSKYYRIDHSGGKITVLVAQDTYRIPLVIRVLASFGKVEGKLVKFE